MGKNNSEIITSLVKQQYTLYPYPPAPADLSKKTYDLFAYMDYIRYIFWPGRPDFKGLKILDAGCGVGLTAVQIAKEHPEIEVIGIDISPTCIKEAKKRAVHQKVTKNTRFMVMSIEKVDSLKEKFDYIISTGVLHHLADPEKGLSKLRSVLSPNGGMGIMLYGTYGRSSIYLMQELLRRITKNQSLSQKTKVARELLKSLPNNHPFNPELWIETKWKNDSGIVDLLLHANDKSFTVPEIFSLLKKTDMKFVRFYDQGAYNPLNYTRNLSIRKILSKLDIAESASVAELLNGNITKHVFFATKSTYTIPEVNKRGTELFSYHASLSPIFFPSDENKQKAHVKLSTTYPILKQNLWYLEILKYCEKGYKIGDILGIPKFFSSIPGKNFEDKMRYFGEMIEFLATQEIILVEPYSD